MKTTNILIALLVITFTFLSCSNDDDNPTLINDEEVITTLRAVFTPTGDGTPVTLQSEDLDGDGPNAPEITISGAFTTNTTYNGSIQLLNETVTPAEDITAEVQSEGEDHQLFFTQIGSIGTFTYNDVDANGNPIGLSFSLTTANASSGTLTIVLKHLPNKDASGVSDGDITNAGGETDIEASFNLTIQ